MRHSALPLAALLTIGAPAAADPRIATRLYEPSAVVTVQGHAGIESTIAFADDERIENVAVGNSALWQVTPNKRANLLFVKPATVRARTNMTVVTDQRTYLFDLVSTAATTPVYMLRFSYPAPLRPAGPVRLAAAPVVVPPPVVPQPVAPPDLNFAWRARGDRQILPVRWFDDGHAVFLEWPDDVALPAILTREPSGAEGPVNFTVRGRYVVVDGVPPQIILRSGKRLATLTPEPGGGDGARPVAEPAASSPREVAVNAPSRPFAHVADGRP